MTNVDLIEAYYAVSADLHARAARSADIAELLAKMADSMSEDRIREHARQKLDAAPPQKPGETAP